MTNSFDMLLYETMDSLPLAKIVCSELSPQQIANISTNYARYNYLNDRIQVAQDTKLTVEKLKLIKGTSINSPEAHIIWVHENSSKQFMIHQKENKLSVIRTKVQKHISLFTESRTLDIVSLNDNDGDKYIKHLDDWYYMMKILNLKVPIFDLSLKGSKITDNNLISDLNEFIMYF